MSLGVNGVHCGIEDSVIEHSKICVLKRKMNELRLDANEIKKVCELRRRFKSRAYAAKYRKKTLDGLQKLREEKKQLIEQYLDLKTDIMIYSIIQERERRSYTW